MPLFYITGVSGTGKTAVRDELRARGYVAYDSDEDNISACIDENGEPAPFPDDPSELLSTCPKGYKYRLVPARVQNLIEEAKTETVFLCGAAGNDKEFTGSFSQIFALTLDKETLIERINTRSGNDFGKKNSQMQMILNWYDIAEPAYRERGAVLVDTSQPVTVVVDEILNQINPQKQT